MQSFYNIDRQNPVRLAPKLTDSHLEPGSLLSMRVKLATQVFSHQVSAAMSLCIIAKLLPPDALSTCEFILKIDTLFDIMNSRKLKADKPARCALTKGETMKTLEDIKNWISTWHYENARSQTSISSQWGLITTINNIMTLSRELLDEGFHFVCTSHFNQDCIENFFSII